MSQIPPKRERYNKKGRAASLEQQKGAKRRRIDYQLEDDSNADIIDPAQQKKRKQQLAEARAAEAAAEPKMSSKKKKRLDAYINRKLKKEDRVALIASLAQTQTQNLDLRSSSALGSKQFQSQADRLQYSATLEAGRRDRAKKILTNAKGKGGGYLSEEDAEEDDNEDATDTEADSKSGRVHELPAIVRSTVTLNSQKPPLFNASGSLGVVDMTTEATTSSSTPAASHASTSTSATASSKPNPPTTAAVGSGLVAGATVTVVKRKPREKGRMRELAGMSRKAKAQQKQQESETETETEFDSSNSEMDSNTDSENSAASSAESWYGIEGNEAQQEDGGNETGEDGDEQQEEEESEEDPNGSDEVAEVPRPKREKGAFQAWADAQILSAAGEKVEPTKSAGNEVSDTVDGVYVPLLAPGTGSFNKPNADGTTGPLGEVIPSSQLPTLPAQRTTHVPVQRTEEIQRQREGLPIVKEEDSIMTAIRSHPVVILCGETGSGKTTQIGQFLWEAGWGNAASDNPGMIAVTQPRRVAALSTCTRVKQELCLPTNSSLVAHRIRFSSTAASDTKIVFMTDGVLLRELAADFLLSKYSVVVIDEAHERGVNTDVLIGTLSRVARLRESLWRESKPGIKLLRLIIMSATLRVADFAENPILFPTSPPVLKVEARQHPVTTHFSRRTSHAYLDQAYKKVARIHTRLPPGGILVFCTGQNEIVSLVKKLEAKFGAKAIEKRKEKVKFAQERQTKFEQLREARRQEKSAEESENLVESGEIEVGDDPEAEEIELGAEDDDRISEGEFSDGVFDENDVETLESDPEDGENFSGLDLEPDSDTPMFILPLYSLLPTEKQMKVFAAPPAGHRLVVIATNVAETSITIPSIKFVVDSGRAKERNFDPHTGIQSFKVGWISKASAAQRAGRAGRTGPGHCYRLYSSAVFENFFDNFTKPEILRMPIEGIVLQMKSMNIDHVTNFPFPTAPDRNSLRNAEKLLITLGGLDSAGKITELGRSMALFPLSPRFSKMILAGQQNQCLPYVIAVVCALSVGDPFIREANLGDDEEREFEESGEKILTAGEISFIRDPELRKKEELKLARKAFFTVQQKHTALGKGASDVFKMLSVVGAYEYEGAPDSFCQANFVRLKAMQEIHKLRAQISKIVSAAFPGIDAGFVPELNPPNAVQLKMLRQLLTSAFIDQVAIRKDLVDKQINLNYGKAASTRGIPYRTFGIDEDLFIHPSSTLFHQSPPEFIVYNELHRTHKVWLKTLTRINSAWLPTLGKTMCTFSKPLDTASSAISAVQRAQQQTKPDPNVRQIFVTPRFGPGVGIELKPILVSQRLVNGRWLLE